MSLEAPRILLLSDTNTANATALLRKKIKGSVIQEIPYNQIPVLLIQEDHTIWSNHYDLLIWWCREEAIKGFTINELSFFFERISGKADFSLWVGFGMGSQNPVDQFELKQLHRLYELNALLVTHCMANPVQRFYVPEDFLTEKNKTAKHSADLWYLTKTLWHKTVYERLAEVTCVIIHQLKGGAVKLVVSDLDDTLWGGIVGDDGWEHLALGGHNAIGEAFSDVQEILLNWKSRGVLLAVVSKNEEQTALEAIKKHPEMKIKEQDLVGWKINWKDKAENIAALAKELNIGLQHILFLDDNPAERERVRLALPEVYVPDLPSNKLEVPYFLKQLSQLPLLNRISEEDKQRAELYRQEQARKQDCALHGSMEDWIRSLEMKITFRPLTTDNLMRATQLLNKTNQMNLRTRRMGEQELLRWAQEKGNEFYTVSVEDKFGSAGLTGLLGMRKESESLILEDFVLSCRVMGRQVEACMITFAIKTAAKQGLKKIIAELIPTAKNNPCKELFNRLCDDCNELTFTWEVGDKHSYPEGIKIVEEPC